MSVISVNYTKDQHRYHAPVANLHDNSTHQHQSISLLHFLLSDRQSSLWTALPMLLIH